MGVVAGAAVLLAGGLAPSSTASAAPAAPTAHTVVATGLANPRGVDVGPGGTVFVAESGAGGPRQATALVEGRPSTVCVGNTGGVTAVIGDVQLRVATLPSTAGAITPRGGGAATCTGSGDEATGPSDVAVGGGRVAVTMGLGGTPETRAGLPADVRDAFGTVRYVRSDTSTALADLAGYEASANPIGPVDSNPYGLARLPGGDYLVTDAGGNDLVRVSAKGATPTVRTVATFPSLPPRPFVPPPCAGSLPPGAFPPAGTRLPAEAVPTSVEVGRNGTYYVGFLTGFPFSKGAASIVRVSPTGRQSTLATGLTQVVGLDLAPDGALYAVELSTEPLINAACGEPAAGDVVRIKNGRRTVIASGLPAPGGISVAADGSFYVSVNSTSARDGELWRFARPRG